MFAVKVSGTKTAAKTGSFISRDNFYRKAHKFDDFEITSNRFALNGVEQPFLSFPVSDIDDSPTKIDFQIYGTFLPT